MQDMIFVSMEDWDEVWRRNQFFCAELSRRFPEQKILFVTPPCDLPNILRKRHWSQLRRAGRMPISDFANIECLVPLKVLPNTFLASRRINDFWIRIQIRRAARQLQLNHPLLWINPMYADHLVGRMGEQSMIYDITDDWTQASFPPHIKKLTIRQDHSLCRAADLVVVCSEALLQSRHELCKQILLLPNGVDASHYAQVTENASPSAKWASPVLGYTGTLHSDRIDAVLVVALARAFPQGSIVLIGPDHLDTQTRGTLEAEPNIFLVGSIPYDCIPEQMSFFNLCIVPHRETSFTESLNPIKLWEYLASGKQIVSTNVAGFRDYHHLCRIASGTDAFIAACHEALSCPDNKNTARRAEVENQSWSRRVDVLLNALAPLLKAKPR